MANQISTQTISFNNQSLITVEQNGNHYVAMKPICENREMALYVTGCVCSTYQQLTS